MQSSHSDMLGQRAVFIFKFRFSVGVESPSGNEVQGQDHSARQTQDWWGGRDDGGRHGRL